MRCINKNHSQRRQYGRGLRIYPGKTECLILDFTDNVKRFKSIDSPFVKGIDDVEKPKAPGGPQFEGPKYRKCKDCLSSNPANASQCSYCGNIFINHTASLTSQRFEVLSYEWILSKTKKKEKCIIVTYVLKNYKYPVKQWILYNQPWAHEGRKQIKKMFSKATISLELDESGSFKKVKNIEFYDKKPNDLHFEIGVIEKDYYDKFKEKRR